VGPFAAGAAARAGEALAVLKNVSTHPTLKGPDNELFSLALYRMCNMGKMFINLLFSDSQGLG
jgi:hypothetical protein